MKIGGAYTIFSETVITEKRKKGVKKRQKLLKFEINAQNPTLKNEIITDT